MPRKTSVKAGRQARPGSRFLSQVLADNLRDLRALHHLSQPQVVERMAWLGHEWGPSTVSEVERGRRNVTTDELLALALLYGRTIGELLDPAGVANENDTPIDLGVEATARATVTRKWLRGGIRIRLAWDVTRSGFVNDEGEIIDASTTTPVEERANAYLVTPAPAVPVQYELGDDRLFASDDPQAEGTST